MKDINMNLLQWFDKKSSGSAATHEQPYPLARGDISSIKKGNYVKPAISQRITQGNY